MVSNNYEDFYIRSYDASKIMYIQNNINNYMDLSKIKRCINKKVYKSKLPTSLEVDYLLSIAGKEFLCDEYKNYYTDAVINISFDYPYQINYVNKAGRNETKNMIKTKKEKGKKIIYVKTANKQTTIFDQKQLRIKLYTDGFNIKIGNKVHHYVYWQRSGSKSRLGEVLFIKQEYLSKMLDWARIHIPFKKDPNKPFKIAELKAYESLALSHLTDRITIKPEQILMIDKVFSDVQSFASVSMYDENLKDVVVNDDETITVRNEIFDGQSLIDESLITNNKCMQLLRHRFFKTAAFSTKLNLFLKDRYDNGIIDDVIKDKFGNARNINDIKLVINPSCLKLDKFKEYIKDGCTDKECYQFWLDSLSENNYTFGVVKSEHESYYLKTQRMSYQMDNCLNFTEEEWLTILNKYDFPYIELLKNDNDFLLYEMGKVSNDEESDLISHLVSKNINFVHTKLFKDKKKSFIDQYIDDLQKGYVKVLGGYCTLLANPYEMLLAITGELTFNDNSVKALHKGWEVYTPMFNNGEMLAAFRNPNICAGNAMACTNVYHDEFKWFNLTNEIAIINPAGCDIMNRLQGCDFDSDNALFTNDDIVVAHAKEAMIKYSTPINKIEVKDNGKNNRYYTNESMSEVDHLLSNNQIGFVINRSQLLNSYYFDLLNNKDKLYEREKEIYIKYNKKVDLLTELYKAISLLSSLSQIEIDRAKHYVAISTEDVVAAKTEWLLKLLQSKESVSVNKKNLNKEESALYKLISDMIKKYIYDIANNKYIAAPDLKKEDYECIKDMIADYFNRKEIEYDKVYVDTNFEKDLNKDLKKLLSKKSYLDIVPNFYVKITSKEVLPINRSSLQNKYFDCGMDRLLNVLKNNIPKQRQKSSKIPLSQLLVFSDDNRSGSKYNAVKELICKLDKDIRSQMFKVKEKRISKHDLIENCLVQLPNDINKSTLIPLLLASLGEDVNGNNSTITNELKNTKCLMFSVLFAKYKNRFDEIFKDISDGKENIKIILASDEDNENIIQKFGVCFKKVGQPS